MSKNASVIVSSDQVAADSKFSKENATAQKAGKWDKIMKRLKIAASQKCIAKHFCKKVPILEWLPKYNLDTGVADLIAGITVGLTVIPQGIAYALVAKLPPQVCK